MTPEQGPIFNVQMQNNDDDDEDPNPTCEKISNF